MFPTFIYEKYNYAMIQQKENQQICWFKILFSFLTNLKSRVPRKMYVHNLYQSSKKNKLA